MQATHAAPPAPAHLRVRDLHVPVHDFLLRLDYLALLLLNLVGHGLSKGGQRAPSRRGTDRAALPHLFHQGLALPDLLLQVRLQGRQLLLHDCYLG